MKLIKHNHIKICWNYTLNMHFIVVKSNKWDESIFFGEWDEDKKYLIINISFISNNKLLNYLNNKKIPFNIKNIPSPIYHGSSILISSKYIMETAEYEINKA